MTERLNSIKQEILDTVNDCLRFCYLARDRKYQIESIERLEELKSRIIDLKTEVIAESKEDAANQLLSLEKVVQAFIYDLDFVQNKAVSIG